MDLNAIENLNIDRVIKRGTAQIIEKTDDAILLKDTRSKALMLACDDVSKGMEILKQNIDDTKRNIGDTKQNNGETKPLIMISNAELGRRVADKFGYENIMECYQMAFLSKEPPKADDVLEYKTATMEDFPLISREYGLVSKEELKELIERGNIVMGYRP